MGMSGGVGLRVCTSARVLGKAVVTTHASNVRRQAETTRTPRQKAALRALCHPLPSLNCPIDPFLDVAKVFDQTLPRQHCVARSDRVQQQLMLRHA